LYLHRPEQQLGETMSGMINTVGARSGIVGFSKPIYYGINAASITTSGIFTLTTKIDTYSALSSNIYTIPIAGTYKISFGMAMSTTATYDYFDAKVYKGGEATGLITYSTSYGNIDRKYVETKGILVLTTSDTISMYITKTGSSSGSVSSGAHAYLIIEFLK